jgi:hypothetical protein
VSGVIILKGEESTYDKVCMDLLPTAGRHLGNARWWELVDVFVEKEVDATGPQTSFKRNTVFVGISRAE